MADEKKVTILNQGKRALVICMKPRKVLAIGGSAEVSEKEAKHLLSYEGVVDLAKVAPQQAEDMEKLRQENEELKKRNAELEAGGDGGGSDEEKQAKAAAKARAAELKKINKKGARVQMEDGGLGTVTKLLSKKDMEKLGLPGDGVEVKLDVNGNVSPFSLDSLKAAPQE